MKVARLSFSAQSGWSKPFPNYDNPSTLVLAFFSPTMAGNPKWLQDLKSNYPNSHILGCSTAGEIHGQELADDSVTVAVTQFEKGQLRSCFEPIQSSEDSFAVGERIALKLKKDDLRGVLILSDGLSVNGSTMAAGINRQIPEVLVTGGLAGDGSRFQQTFVINGSVAAPGFVSAIGFYGENINMSFGSQGGWDIFGPERVVTRSQGNILYELDNKPALDIYKSYLGDRSKDLPSSGLLFPLQIREKTNNSLKLVRTILAVDESKKALIFAGDIPTGYLAQLMKANFERLIDGASNAADHPFKQNAECTLAIAISCVGRRLVLRDRTEEEIEATLSRLPTGTEQIGFYSYGELAPHSKFIKCELHNQTMTITTISEAA
jgi:hypothetical protein